MIVNNKTEAEKYINDNNPNRTNPRYLAHISERIRSYPINIQYCLDEYTGFRFGRAICRRDKNPLKISVGGRNRGSNQAYQLWVWDI